MNSRISIIVVCDHALSRTALAHWLDSARDFVVVASVANAAEAIAEAKRSCADIILLDITVPGLHAIEAARTIRTEAEHSRLVVLSSFDRDSYIEQALAIGASGYLTRLESPEAVGRALKSIASGLTYYSPEVLRRVKMDAAGERLSLPSRSRFSTLTPREVEILCYLAQGFPKRGLPK